MAQVRNRRGQVLPLALLAVLTLAFAALWLADVHHAIRARDKTQNAGDAAALEAARWLGITLNLEGNLNLAHAVALGAGAADAVDAITNVQLRALFSGPLVGVAAAQQAAKLNGSPSNDDFTDFVARHATTVRRGYGESTDAGVLVMDEPWPGAWGDYADMLSLLAADGIAAGIDNAAFYADPQGSHWLLAVDFYDAILGRSWCWFRHFAPSLLSSYTGYEWWPPLPERPFTASFSPELLPLWLHPSQFEFSGLLESRFFLDAAENAGFLDALPAPDSAAATNAVPEPWMVFDRDKWGAWTAMKDPAFPIDGRLRPHFDVAGADAAIRVENRTSALSRPERGAASVSWSAAAKPFGFLRDPESTSGKVPVNASPIVLPVWSEVRLIPLDASSMPSGGAFNLAWRKHCVEHLPQYLDRGISATVRDCRWCDALATWEKADFRREGARWLSTNAWKCAISPPGNSPGGGSRHAH